MKSTGIARKIDTLGRFVIPKELRRILEIDNNDAIEIFTEEDKVILKKYMPACIFCGNATDVIYFKGKLVCKDCLKEMQKEN